MSDAFLNDLATEVRAMRADITEIKVLLAEQRGERRVTGKFVAAIGSVAALLMTLVVDVVKSYVLKGTP